MKSKILIVEDESTKTVNLEKSLKSLGYDVVGMASTGKDAVEIVDRLKPDLVLMDIVLKGEMDGIEAAYQIKEEYSTPVLHLTAHPEESAFSDAKLTTPYDYLIKPVNKLELKIAIELAICKHQMEYKLNEGENKYIRIFENVYDSIIFRTVDFEILDANPSACRMFGYSYPKLVGKSFKELIDTRYLGLLSQIKDNIEKKGYYNYEIIFLDQNDHEIHAEVKGRKIKFFNQDAVLTIIRDVTEYKKLEKELIKSREHFKTVADFTFDWEYWIGPDGNLIYVSPSCERITGYKREEFIEDPSLLEKIVHPDDIEMIRKHLHEASKNENSEIRTYRIITKHGEEKWIGHGCQPVYNDKGKFLGRRVSNRDITHRIKAEDDLRESEEFLDSIVDNVPNMIFVKNADDLSFRRVNKAGEIYFGKPRNELIGKHDYDFFPRDEAEFFTQKDREVLQSKKLLDIPEETIKSKELGSRLLHTKKIPLLDREGNPQYLLGISEDITELKIAENKIKESLKEKENLLKEIHHRVKNNLQIISSLLDLQEDYVKDDPTAMNVLKESQNRVLSMAMIHEMLYQSEDLNSIDFSAYLRNLISNLCNSYGVYNVQSIIDVKETYLNMETSVPLGLITSELISNSLKHAFPEKTPGELTISLQNEDDHFELIIKDDGIGISEEVDFKNIKSTLGLKLVHSLIKQIDGTIKLDRSHGTKYTIKFKELKYKERI